MFGPSVRKLGDGDTARRKRRDSEWAPILSDHKDSVLFGAAKQVGVPYVARLAVLEVAR